MDSEEDFKDINFSCPEEDLSKASLTSTDHSELRCEDDSPKKLNSVEDTFFKESILSENSSEDENLFFSSVADFEREEEQYLNSKETVNQPTIEQTSSFSKTVKRLKLDEEHTEEDDTIFESSYNIQNDLQENHDKLTPDKEIKTTPDKDIDEVIYKTPDHMKNTTPNKDINMTPEVGFKTGNNKKILINAEILNRAPKFSPAYRKGPMRSYNCPEKGHISSEIEERNKYMHYFEKVKSEFKKTDLKLLQTQYRWVWLNLFLNKQLGDSLEASRLLIEGVRNRLNSEYSILRRIIEGDDVSYRYMILLVLSFSKDILEVFDGYFTCKIRVDNLLSKYLQSKKISLGFKIKLFGCKFVLSSNMSILEYNDEDVVMLASFNSFDFALPNRVLGYRKKISFGKNIKDIRKEGGIVSCLKGTVKRIVDSRYVVQVKGYRNSVENLEKELENIQNLLEKTKEEITSEDVKIKKYVRFILGDSTGEVLVTSWMYTEDIRKDIKIMLCGLKPVESALGLHLTTNKQTYIKFYK